MTSLQLLLLVFVQAATEFLPVSSSGHLLFLKELFNLEEIPVIFDVVLPVGNLTAIVFFYWCQITRTLTSPFGELKFHQSQKPQTKFLLFAIGSTIAILLLLNIKRDEAAYYSFFLAIPAILGAVVFQIMEIESKSYLLSHGFLILASFFIAAGFSYLFLKLLTLVIQKGKFWALSIYTFGLAIAAFIIF